MELDEIKMLMADDISIELDFMFYDWIQLIGLGEFMNHSDLN